MLWCVTCNSVSPSEHITLLIILSSPSMMRMPWVQTHCAQCHSQDIRHCQVWSVQFRVPYATVHLPLTFPPPTAQPIATLCIFISAASLPHMAHGNSFDSHTRQGHQGDLIPSHVHRVHIQSPL